MTEEQEREMKISAIQDALRTPKPFHNEKRGSLTGVQCHGCEGVSFMDEDEYIEMLLQVPIASYVCSLTCLEIFKLKNPAGNPVFPAEGNPVK